MLVTLSVGHLVTQARNTLQTTDYTFTPAEILNAAVNCINGDIDCAMDNLFSEINKLDDDFANLPYDTPSDHVLKDVIKTTGREINTTLYRLCNGVLLPRFIEAGTHHLTLTLEE